MNARERSPDRRTAERRQRMPKAAARAPNQRTQILSGEYAQTLAFVDITQLSRLEGMTRERYRQLEPFVTVHSKDGRINSTYAPKELLAAVPGLTRRDASPPQSMPPRIAGVQTATSRDGNRRRRDRRPSDGSGPAYIVSVEGRRAAGSYRGRQEYVLGVGLDDNAPYRLLSSRPLTIRK